MSTASIADEILPGLWLGNRKASVSEEFIRSNGIHVVFNCTKDLPFSPIIPIQYRIPLDDNLKEDEIRNMERWSNEIVYSILSEYHKGRPILVHCMAGMQRSAAAVAMVLIAELRISGLQAYQMIKEKRSIAFHPRANFGRAIDYFDRQFHSEILQEMKKLKNAPHGVY
jgi:dual specificity MAP kinase phosphatase